MSEKLYWHFAALDDDGKPIMRDGTPIEVGKRYEIDGDIQLCARGYHGSLRAIDALRYAPGHWVSRRPLEGVIDGADKSVGRAFTQQPGFDATDALRDFARWSALQVIDLWDAPDVVRRYLETRDESMREAARAAASYAARAAARAAASYAARAAASYAAKAAAWDAAWDAASYAAKAAAWDAAWDVQNTKLDQLLLAALQEAGDE